MVNFDRMIKSRNFVLASPDLYVNDLKTKLYLYFYEINMQNIFFQVPVLAARLK